MSADNPRTALARPTLAMLPRVSDNLSFLYADIVRIVQTDTGVCAETETDSGHIQRVYLPTASLGCLLLGPGTSITQPALATFLRHGTTVVTSGSGGILHYGAWQPSEKSTFWLQHQVAAYADEARRLEVARAMYEMRFEETPPAGVPVGQLRRLEGNRMQKLYRNLSTKYKLQPFRRNYDPGAWDRQNPINKAYGAANAALYGVVHTVIAHLGCSPALGFVHHGKQHSFVYDVADLYKAETTVPLAFSLHASDFPERDARYRLRTHYRLYRLIPRMVRDIQYLLAPEDAEEEDEAEGQWRVVELWDPDGGGSVGGGVNYGGGDAARAVPASELDVPEGGH
ncbi:type I-E CRISPR-associated endonuclease Cas1e [Streptomonospora salina]|uniref:CRISPR-associated endonuclease Cas1 n=1 Tax=Streptomonospora salina TaxID=104205 RepID=A0A841EI69_9ACTN|nr:type I-E CRISPR-associated endonuclease Cas1e [Streptomonospora salina]MBB6000060.1 CRISPR-associated protein Cas1 [Streptomonospora salina]